MEFKNMSNELERLSKRTQEMLEAAGIKDVSRFNNWRVDEVEYFLYWELVYQHQNFPRLEIGEAASEIVKMLNSGKMIKNEIEGLYVYGAYVEPVKLESGKYGWVVTDFAYAPDLYDSEGTPLEESLFSYEADSKDELLNPFNEQEEQK